MPLIRKETGFIYKAFSLAKFTSFNLSIYTYFAVIIWTLNRAWSSEEFTSSNSNAIVSFVYKKNKKITFTVWS